MADVEHGILVPTFGSGIHTAIGWPAFPTDADRLAQGVAEADVGKLALVTDTQKIYVLTAAIPTPRWFEACTVDELEASLDLKADDTDIVALAAEIATKADAAAMTAALATKADAAATQTALDGKVDDAEFSTLSNEVALKADKTYVDTQIDGRASDAELSALDARVTTLETSGPGTGNVQGPAASLDNQLARFSGTTGKTIKAGSNAPTYDDGGNILMAAGAFVDGVDVSVLGATVTTQGTTLTNKVTGPAAANDNAVARYDGTTGKLTQDSQVTIDDTGNIALVPAATVDGVDVSVLGGTVTSLSSTVAGHTTQLTSTVAGPAGPATDNAVMRWDGAGARTSQNSLVTIDDAGNITLPAGATVDGVDVSAIAVSGGAPAAAQYLTLLADAALTSERVFTPGPGLAATVGLPGAAYTLYKTCPSVTVTGSKTLTVVDAETCQTTSGSGVMTMTMPAATFTPGARIWFIQGAGTTLRIVPTGNAVIYCGLGSSPVAEVYVRRSAERVELYYLGSSTWIATGNVLGLDAPGDATYLTLAAHTGMPNERVLTQGPGILFTDGGPGGALTIAAGPLVTRTASGTTDTFVLGDAQNAVEYTSASAVIATVPTNATVAYPLGTVIIGAQIGAGQVTFSPAGGVTLRVPPGLAAKTSGQYTTIALRKRATDEWVLSGMLGT